MKEKGFTLIELLVVMTIIAVLAGLALVSYQGARKTARDGKRKADLETIRSALEMCYSDDNEYPDSIVGSVTCNISGNTYLEVVPSDPISGRLYGYNRISDVSYTLCAALETVSGSESNCASCGTATCNYKVTNP